jgi:hypothetical protein
MNYGDDVKFEILLGKTFTDIRVNKDTDEITFVENNGDEYLMGHVQDCCESVTIEDICGEIEDLVGTPILDAREESNDKNPEGVTKGYQDSFTWTFYILRTLKGSVTIRWYGESNGYYSESVELQYHPKAGNA